jgi:hypothetical protein
MQAAPLLRQPPRPKTAEADLASAAEAAALASAAADDAILRRHVRIVLRDAPVQEAPVSPAAALKAAEVNGCCLDPWLQVTGPQ